jgi:cysteine desulfurase
MIALVNKIHESDMIYLDHNAASPILDRVKEGIFSLPNIALNPSSIHTYGRVAKAYIENARNDILKSLRIDPKDDLYNLVFTSCGTESNNTVIKAFNDRCIISSKIEHLSVLLPVKDTNNHKLLDVDQYGVVDLNQLENYLINSGKPAFVTIAMANNETGVIQHIKSISDIAHKYGAIFHTDAIQAYGKVPLDLGELDCDLATIACHKIGGPKGVAAIISKKSIVYPHLLMGGGQERGKRAGTENVEAIYGFGLVAQMLDQIIENNSKLSHIRDYIEDCISQKAADTLFFSKNSIEDGRVKRLPNTSCIYMPGKTSQLQQIAFDLNKIAISAGSACSSGKITSSHVIEAMGFDQRFAANAIRVSLGHNNSIEDGKKFIEIWDEIFSNSKIMGQKI